MGLESIASVRIHPAIGIARVGNSDEFFVGPELPYPLPRPLGFYKDAIGKLKRQAALFRAYGYDAQGNVVAELTGANADIEWTVHVANRKSAWYDFDVALDIPEAAAEQSQRRNANFVGDQRKALVIDPGPRSVRGANAEPAPFDSGTFVDRKVYLGELRTDGAGRLLFLGGRGVSASYTNDPNPITFANNDGWHDDTADGPVRATVTVGGKTLVADPAWVVVAPPNYGPDLVTPQTMYDVIDDALAGSWTRSAKTPGQRTPSFRDDVLPLLEQMMDAQWVNAGFLAQFGWHGPNDFSRGDVLWKLSRKPRAGDDRYGELRRQVFYLIRKPGAALQQPLLWPYIYGDAFGNYDDSPRVYFAVTKTRWLLLEKWADGDFVDDYGQPPRTVARLEDVPLGEQPATLDRAALHWCMGGPFHPGCELTWPMRRPTMYRAPFRVAERPANASEPDYGPVLTWAIASAPFGPLSGSAPGDLTRWMAVPWQTDTASCRSGYTWNGNPYPDTYIPTFWPSRVPNDVMTEHRYALVVNAALPMDVRLDAFYHRVRWLRGFDYDGPYLPQIARMIVQFGDLGVIEARPNPHAANLNDPFPAVLYVESKPTVPADPAVLDHAHDERDTLRPNPEFTRVRFGGIGRR